MGCRPLKFTLVTDTSTTPHESRFWNRRNIFTIVAAEIATEETVCDVILSGLCTVWKNFPFMRNIIEVRLVIIRPQRPRNQKKGKENQKIYCMVTKRDTETKYPDTTRKSVMTEHFSPIPSRHASTHQCTYKYWPDCSKQDETFTLTKLFVY